MSDEEGDDVVEEQGEEQPNSNKDPFDVVHGSEIDYTDTTFLNIPSDFMHPPRMSTSTEFARIIEPHEIATTPGSVLVLFSHGGTTMPEHFQKMIHCLGVVARNVKNLNPYVYENDEVYSEDNEKTKKPPVTSIKRAFPCAVIETEYEDNFIQTRTPILCANALATKQMGKNEVDIKQELCTVEWGIIPYRYVNAEDVEIRDVFQILRVVPCYGLYFPQYLQHVLTSATSRPMDKELDEASKMLMHILYVEMNHVGMSPFIFPAPLSSESCLCPTSIVSLLSPFMILRKILRAIPGGYKGGELKGIPLKQETLEIHGVPPCSTPDLGTDAIVLYDDMHKSYIEYLEVWTTGEKLDAAKKQCNLLYRENFFIPFQCAVTMQLYPGFKDVRDICSKRITLPLILSTLLTNYKFVQGGNDSHWAEVRNRYINAQCGADTTELTPVRLQQFYRSARTVNYPEAGMYNGMRKAMESLILKESINDDVCTYNQYLKYCYTILMEQQIDGFFMSERVRHSAEILKRSRPIFCENVQRALRSFGQSMSRQEDYIIQQVMHDEIMHTMFLFQRGMCMMNKSTKATAINLALVYACMISDVLCYLGMDNNSWTWCFFPILVCGGGGHLRAHTEDGHTQKTDCVYLAKASSVGFNAVVVSTMNSILGLVSVIYPEISPEVVNVMKLLKIDRATRVAIEESSAVQSANGVVFQVPDPSSFMRVSVFDELARNASEDAINGLITSGFPRDKSGGGSTHKSVESKNRGPRELQETKILRGMGFYSILQAQNRNCANATVAESYKALVAGAVACFVPSAQPSPGFPSLDETRRRKKHRCNIYESCNASGESQLPEAKDVCEQLAWVYTMLPMNCRSIGLLNKMAMTNVVVNCIEQQIYKWFGATVYNFFRPLIGSMLTLSFWRVLNGYLSRGVASSFIITNALQVCVNESFESANIETIAHMESGIGLHGLNNALLDGLTHLLDFNLVIVNKIIMHKLETPCLPIGFLKDLFNSNRRIRERWPAECDVLCAWFTTKLTGDLSPQNGYVPVVNLGEKLDYLFYEQYLEVYCSVVAGSYVTYQKAVNECLGRIIDFSNFFSLEISMLKCTFAPLSSMFSVSATSEIPALSCNFLHVTRRDKNEKYHVHVAQHLLLTSLMGDGPLHSDNIYSWGKRLMQLLINELGVRQQVPGGILAHSFDVEYGHIIPSLVEFAPVRYYMLRSRKDVDAWMRGKSTELVGCFKGHCIEDVMHIGSWVQFANMMDYRGAFEPLPVASLRLPELVPGRIYPMKSMERGMATICICPRGENHVLVHEVRHGTSVFPLPGWSIEVIHNMGYQIAPLVFRPNAAAYIDDKFVVLKPFVDDQFAGVSVDNITSVQSEKIRQVESYNFLNMQGSYKACGETECRVYWTILHESLLPLGSWVYVTNIVPEKVGVPNCMRVRGWLRYQDESASTFDEDKVYVAFRVARTSEGFDSTRILAVHVSDCYIDSGGMLFCDFLLP